MKIRLLSLLCVLLIATSLGGCITTTEPLVETRPPLSSSSSLSTSLTATTPTTTTASAPTTTPAPEPPPPPVIDVDRLADTLSTALQNADSPIPVTRDFLKWLADTYGETTLTELESALNEQGYSNTLGYELTANSIFVLSDLYTADNIRLISTGKPGVDNATTTLTFGGDICLADNYVVMEYMKENELGITDCIDPKLIAEMTAADIAFMNNEFTISDRGAPLANKAYTFRAAPENTALYRTLGIDIVRSPITMPTTTARMPLPTRSIP